jgi:hypothetical protein
MLSRFCQLGWVLRDNKSRAMRFTSLGERKFQTLFSGAAPDCKNPP